MGADGKGKGKGAPRAPPAPPDPEAKEKARLAKEAQRLADEQAAKELEEAQQKQREFAARLSSCTGRSIDDVPWDQATICKHMAGGKGNEEGGCKALLIGEGSEVVCVRESVDSKADLVGLTVMNCIGANVAQFRCVNVGTEELEQVEAALTRADPIMALFVKTEWPKMQKAMEAQGLPMEEIMKLRTWARQVLEFVPGHPMGSALQGGLCKPSEDMFFQIGRICAADLLLNNMDRVPLTVWDNPDGNLSNVMITNDGGVKGIDQQVFLIVSDEGKEEYISRITKLVSHIWRSDFKHMEVESCMGKVEEAVLRQTSVQLNSECLLAMMKGIREGFVTFGQSWTSGTFKAKLEGIVEEANSIRDKTQGAVKAKCEDYVAFVLRVAEEVASIVC